MASTINAKSTGSGSLESTADASGVLALQTGGVTALTIDASQNVGIGTTSPTGNLDIASSSNVNVYIRQTTGVCNTRIKSDSTNAAIGTSTNHQFSLLQNNTEGLTIDTSQNLKFNSGYGSVATAYGCRAWVNFNGTGTVAIRGSANVTSITDNGVGDYTVNLTTAMPDTNYCGVALPNDGTPGTNLVIGCENSSRTKSTSAFHVWTAYGGNGSNKTLYDVNTVNVAIFR